MLKCRDSETSRTSISSESEAKPPLAARVSPSTKSGTNGIRAHPSKPQASCCSLDMCIRNHVHGSNCFHLDCRNRLSSLASMAAGSLHLHSLTTFAVKVLEQAAAPWIWFHKNLTTVLLSKHEVVGGPQALKHAGHTGRTTSAAVAR